MVREVERRQRAALADLTTATGSPRDVALAFWRRLSKRYDSLSITYDSRGLGQAGPGACCELVDRIGGDVVFVGV